MKRKRNSSFELIKVLAIICIVFCHSVPAERVEYHYATSDPWLFLVIMFRQLGSVGNAIFMVASTWFLVDSDNTNLRKIKQMIADNQLISLICLAAMWMGGYHLSEKVAAKQAFPFLFNTLWYITCYVLYYCLHGFVNRGLRGIKVNSKIPLILIFICDIIIYIFGGFYYTDLMGFILIHVCTWYLRELQKDKSGESISSAGKRLLIVGLLGWILGAITFNYVGLRISFIGSKFYYWNRYFNPFILAMAYGMMMLASQRKFKSNWINNLSSLSLFIYMFTGNQLLRIYPDNELYDLVVNRFGTSMLVCVLFVIVYSLIKLVAGIGISWIYKLTLGKLTKTISDKECDWIGKRIAKIK